MILLFLSWYIIQTMKFKQTILFAKNPQLNEQRTGFNCLWAEPTYMK